MSGLNIDVSKIGVQKSSELLDIFDDPERYLIIDKNETIICIKCKKPYTIRDSIRCTTYRCGCGCRIIYHAKNEGEPRLTTWVSAEAFNPHRRNGGKP
jgi:hypothetical protein